MQKNPEVPTGISARTESVNAGVPSLTRDQAVPSSRPSVDARFPSTLPV